LNPDEVTVDIERAGEAEMDEMWSFVGIVNLLPIPLNS
jgi:hypothetical protein